MPVPLIPAPPPTTDDWLAPDADEARRRVAALDDAFHDTFGRSAVAAGALDALLRDVKRVPRNRRVRGVHRMLLDLRGAVPVDRDFLQRYRLRLTRSPPASSPRCRPT